MSHCPLRAPLFTYKGSGVPDTKIHHAFTRAPTVYQSLLWASSNYRQIEVREAGGGRRAACPRSHSKSVTEPRVITAPASQCLPSHDQRGVSRIFFLSPASFLVLTFPALLQGEPFPLITTAAVLRIALEPQATSTPSSFLSKAHPASRTIH